MVMRFNRQLFVVLALTLSGSTAVATPSIGICDVLHDPAKYGGHDITVRATVLATMHGVFLQELGCANGLLTILPTDAPDASPHIQDDADFRAFERARSDYRLRALASQGTYAISCSSS